MFEKKIYEILKKIWGYDQFRSLQKEVILSVLEKKDTLLLMPTSGGKSLCYQLPIILQDGVGIIITPLIALMEDQVKQLQNKGIKAIALTGQIHADDIIRIFDNLQFGDYKFLYLSPERLQHDWIMDKIITLKPKLLVVDEAHCVSEWGHDFRPAYLKIHKLKTKLNQTTCLALTATATENVKQDILKYIGLENPKIFQMSFKRHNIAYDIRRTENKLIELEKSINKEESTIVYTNSRKLTYELSQQLNTLGIKSTFYHGGLSINDKTKNMNSWMSNENRIMVATNAFGMGIDKPDVRLVIHYHIPQSIENYYQETGRAGRDGQSSRALLIYQDYELKYLNYQTLRQLPTFSELLNIYKKLSNFFQIPFGEGFGEKFSFNILEFCKIYQFDIQKVFSALLFLNNQSIINFETTSSDVIQIQCLLDNKEMIRFVSLNKTYEKLLFEILRRYTGIYEQMIDLNMEIIEKVTQKSQDEIIKQLKQLHDQKIIHLNLMSNDSKITWLEAREDEYTINKTKKYYDRFVKNKIDKTNAIFELISNRKICLNKLILNYFGEIIEEDCKICFVCKNKTNQPNTINERILTLLSKKSTTLKDIQLSLDEDNQLVFSAIDELFEREIILLDENQKFYINKK